MNPENKQRIVGVIVLVAFVALLIPFLFTSGVKKKNQLAASGNESIPIQVADVNSQVTPEVVADKTQVDSSPQMPVTVQPEVLPKEQIENQMLPSEMTSSESVIPPASGTADVDVKTTAPVTVTEAVDKVEPAIAEKAKSEATPKTQKNVVKSKKIKTAIKSKAKSVAKNKALFWSVQVGSFSDQARMQKMVTNLQTKGFQVYLQKISTSRGLMVRVLVGRETDKAKALKIAQQLKVKLKIDGRVVENKK